MPVYVYGCDTDIEHERIEIVHAMNEEPGLKCACGSSMHRIPQPLRGWYRKPTDTLLEWMSANYRLARTKAKYRHSKDHVNHVDGTLRQSQYGRK